MNNSLIFLGTGKCSTFGGGQDNGVGIHEGLAVVDQSDLADWYFSRLFERPIFGRRPLAWPAT